MWTRAFTIVIILIIHRNVNANQINNNLLCAICTTVFQNYANSTSSLLKNDQSWRYFSFSGQTVKLITNRLLLNNVGFRFVLVFLAPGFPYFSPLSPSSILQKIQSHAVWYRRISLMRSWRIQAAPPLFLFLPVIQRSPTPFYSSFSHGLLVYFLTGLILF